MNETLDRLARFLTDERCQVQAEPDGIRVSRWDGYAQEPPIKFEFTSADLDRLISTLDPGDKASLWPDRSDEDVVFGLLLVSLDAAMRTRDDEVAIGQLLDGQFRLGPATANPAGPEFPGRAYAPESDSYFNG